MRQIPIKMLKQHAIPNSSLHNLKIYSSKGCGKTMDELPSQHSNSKYSNFQQKISLQIWVFASTGAYFYCWHWQVLHNVLQSKYDAKTFKNLV